MAKLAKEDILKLARLARLRLSEDEITKYQKELESILQYVEQLNDIDLTEYEPTSQVTGLTNIMRDDVPLNQASTTDLLKNLPDRQGDYIKVKRMLG